MNKFPAFGTYMTLWSWEQSRQLDEKSLGRDYEVIEQQRIVR